ncbi:MAG: acetylornithine deacetylase [Marivibrio sp.]|uniref:acetylornithine deacetylase n=1 Tax=Marivibrio sp. TaxID=2039719 RepID=UPI0032EA9893
MPKSLEILDRLIAFETVSRRPNIDLIRYVKGVLTQAGVACRLVESADGANANLYARTGPDGPGGVMLSGHTDVVPTDGQDWTVAPFRMHERDGKLYGRGTADMKGFVACAIGAMIEAAGRPLARPLQLALSYDEEIGCVGVRSLLDMLSAAPERPDLCIVGEPTSLAVATGHKGKIAARAVCTGREVHSALAPQGVNAIHLAAEFVRALQALQAEFAETGAQDDAYDVPYSTLHVGTIAGGTALNIVPNRCELAFEIRHLPEDDADALLARVEAAAAAIAQAAPDGGGVGVETVNRYPGLATPSASEAVSFVKSLTGANATTKVAFGTEGGLIDARLGVPVVICGPGSMAQGHKPDEYVALSQIDACDRMLAALTARLAA